MKDEAVLMFLKALSAWIEKQKQQLTDLQTLIRDLSTEI